MRYVFVRSFAAVLVAMAIVVVAPKPAAAVTCPSGANLSNYNSWFTTGPSIPYTRTDYVPQGLGYWPGQTSLIASYADGGPNMIAVKNLLSGSVKKLYVKDWLGNPIGGHMGGLSVSGSNVWISTVSGTSNLFRIPLSSISSTANGGSVRANASYNVAASSYSTYYDGYLYVGAFSAAETGTASMYRYALSSSEAISGSPVRIATPTQVQGATVADGYYIFSTSYGRNCYSRLKFKKIGTETYGRVVWLPPMSEGIVRVPGGAAGWAGDQLYVSYESGSNQYADAAVRTFSYTYAPVTTLTP